MISWKLIVERNVYFIGACDIKTILNSISYYLCSIFTVLYKCVESFTNKKGNVTGVKNQENGIFFYWSDLILANSTEYLVWNFLM